MEEPSSHVKNFLSNSFDNVSLNSIIKDVEDIPQIQRGHTNFLELSKDLKVLSRSGRLLPLKTAAERQAANAMIDVYAVAVPSKYASAVLSVIKEALPDEDTVDLQHLRRFARPDFLPAHLRVSETTAAEGLQPLDATAGTDATAVHSLPVQHLLVSPASMISTAELRTLLSQHPPFLDSTLEPNVRVISVPRFAPTSVEQANEWSRKYWPSVFRNTNPFGPHPAIVKRAQAEILPSTGKWMALAELAAGEACESGIGEEFGCAIVERRGGREEIVAVAGDGRWRGLTEVSAGTHECSPGNVMAHAVMRAIGMVAQKRSRLDDPPLQDARSAVSNGSSQGAHAEPNLLGEGNIFVDRPLTHIEKRFFDLNDIAAHGYLCVDLEIYISHEPCVMCSMAILHSRFGRCVFGRRMPLTGAMTADADIEETSGELSSTGAQTTLGYGLFWRPELNWKFLAWQWEQDAARSQDTNLSNESVQV